MTAPDPTAGERHTDGCDEWTAAAPGQRGCVCHVWNKGRPTVPEHRPECVDDEYDCRCGTDPSTWRPPATARLTDAERECAYPMEQGDFYLEDDVERIIAERCRCASGLPPLADGTCPWLDATPASPPAVAASTGTSEDVATPNVIQRIVNAWDCCGTCAGGVLARHVADREAAARAEERERIARAIEEAGRRKPRDPQWMWATDAAVAARIAREGR